MGNFNGFNIVDIANPAAPTIVTSVVCPGGQGDMSVHGNLLFMSVEETRGRLDCGTDPTVGTRFQGVRIFDVSNVLAPVQVAAVQTCRGSHTHSIVTDPDDPANVYVYVSGTTDAAPGLDHGRLQRQPADRREPVPLAHRDHQGAAGQPGRGGRSSVSPACSPTRSPAPSTGCRTRRRRRCTRPACTWGPTPITDACHDITSYPAIGLAAAACEGNGILIDISDPENPVRLDEVSDPNFAYWHSATLNNDGTKVIFTDEWGGGTSARCRVTDQPQWGANAIYDIVDGQMQFASYYKLPVPQMTRRTASPTTAR